jgi:hypothetical protein
MLWHMLSNEQILQLKALIDRENIEVPGLADDLLDHFCCCVEEAMGSGLPFEDALPLAYARVFPGGIKEIEEDVIRLITVKTSVTMKKALYVTGFVSAFLISTGFLFRYMHWPAAVILLSLGFLFLLFAVVPLVAIVTVRSYPSMSAGELGRIISGLIAVVLISSGLFFKLQHWPSANIQFVLGMIILNTVFLPLLFYKLYNRTTQR